MLKKHLFTNGSRIKNHDTKCKKRERERKKVGKRKQKLANKQTKGKLWNNPIEVCKMSHGDRNNEHSQQMANNMQATVYMWEKLQMLVVHFTPVSIGVSSHMCVYRMLFSWHKHHVLLDTNDDLNSLTRIRTVLFRCSWVCAYLCECVRFDIANDFNQIVVRITVGCTTRCVSGCLCVLWFFPCFLFSKRNETIGKQTHRH